MLGLSNYIILKQNFILVMVNFGNVAITEMYNHGRNVPVEITG